MAFKQQEAIPTVLHTTPKKLSRRLLTVTLATVVGSISLFLANAKAGPADAIKIGLSAPLTGPFAENGKQMIAAAKLFMEQNDATIVGRQIQLIVRDDGGVPDQARRIAQEFVVNDKVAVLAGYNPTPNALAVAPIATEARIPEIVVGAVASIITARSPYIVRTMYAQTQVTIPMAQWAAKNGIKRVVTLVSDYSPGLDAEKAFIDQFKIDGGEIVEAVRVPLQNPDYAPYLQRARDAKPDALFVWVPGGLAAALMRQYAERGLNQSGMKLIGVGDITDDAVLNQAGDAMLGVITSMQYSAAHPSAMNKAFVEGFRRVGNGIRPDHVGVAVYDALHLIYAAIKKTAGNANGDALITALKGMAWESPRGPVSIDPETREMVQDVYIRRVERVDGELYNVEFEKFTAVKVPAKTEQAR
jgi:branched-chain amino acid transport system substrate-binding protein